MMKKFPKNSEICRIDKKDIEILRILEEDARTPLTEIARKVKLSHETVRYRLRKLVKSGVIEKFTIRIDKKKLGYNFYAVIMIATWNCTKEKWEEFFDYLLKHKNVVSVEKITGNYDVKISFWARDSEEFDSISHSIKMRFSKIIKDWKSFVFVKQYKWKELPF